jgi:hypothetical protein
LTTMIWPPDHVKSFSCPFTMWIIRGWRVSSNQSSQKAEQVSRCRSASRSVRNSLGKGEVGFYWHLLAKLHHSATRAVVKEAA